MFTPVTYTGRLPADSCVSRQPGPNRKRAPRWFSEKTACIYPALVEGISLGALMESALLPLRHVSGLELAQPRYRLEGAGLTGLPSLRHSCNLREESVFYAARR